MSYLRKLLFLKLHWQILIALVLALVFGLITTEQNTTILCFYDFIGATFLRLLKMIIVPLVVASIVTGVMGLGSGSSLGKLGLKTFVYYIATSLFAILTGLVLVNIITPGMQNGNPVGILLGFSETVTQSGALEQSSFSDMFDIFKRMIPVNIIDSLAQADMLPIIFFSILFGAFIPQTGKKSASFLSDLFNAFFEVMMKITHFIIRFAPIGVFGLVAATITKTGFSSVLPLLKYSVTVLLGLCFHFFFTLPLLVRIFTKTRPWFWQHKQMLEALLMAFSTSSSQATLPVTMKCVEENLKVPNKISSFVLPLGATVNMDGTALYECVAAMFIAQAYGIELGILQQALIVLTALLASIGAAAIPHAGLIMIVIILKAVGLPLEGIGLILAVDRLLDMCRTTVNVFSDSCGATVVYGRKATLISE